MGLFWMNDPRNLMFAHLARLVDEFIAIGARPGNVIIENVPSIAYRKNIRIVQDLVRFFTDRKYRCAADVVNFASWGLPQLRHRFVLIATMADTEPSLPLPVASLESGAGLVTAWDAISDLAAIPPVPHGEVVRLPVPPQTEYQRAMRTYSEPVHNHHEGRTADIDIERIRHVPQGGSWKDIPPALLPDRFRKVRMTDYKTLYGRIHKDHPSYTIYSAYGNVTSGCFTHPDHDRPLTVREGCRLQGFSDDFLVLGSLPSQYRQIGNAVPAFAAKVLLEHWQAVLGDKKPLSAPMRLDAALLSTEPLRLPVLTPRYSRIGYGAGTYWPKGWGTRPDVLPAGEADYRISSDPISYRRQLWRARRDDQMLDSVREAGAMDWSGLIAALPHDSEATILIDSLDVSTPSIAGSKDHARKQFMRFIGPTGAVVTQLARRRKRVVVHCDLTITATLLATFLDYYVTENSIAVRVSDDVKRVGAENVCDSEICLTVKPVYPNATLSTLVLAHPFAGLNGFRPRSTMPLPVPTEALRAFLLDGNPFGEPPERTEVDDSLSARERKRLGRRS